MRKLTLMAASVAMVAAAQVNAGANDTARVNAEIPPQIQIGGSGGPGGNPVPPAPTGESPAPSAGPGGSLGGIAYGQTLDAVRNGADFYATGYWLIHSNVQTNQFGCGATDLYKGGVNPVVGGDANTTPIPVNQSLGAQITASLASDTSGGNGQASYVSSEVEGAWTFYTTEKLNFHAGTQEPTQWVGCTIHWQSDDPEKAQGEYIGFMRVYAMYGAGA